MVAREGWYGVTGYPTVKIDGKFQSVGGGQGCNAAYNTYRNYYNQRMNEMGSISPVSVEGFLVTGQSSGFVQADFELLDPVALGSVRATIFVYEDDITWCCGSGNVDYWNHVVRFIGDETVTTLNNVGDRITVVKSFDVDPSWNPDNLHAVAILQTTTGNKAIWQAGRMTLVHDFQLDLARRVGSVPEGNSFELFTGSIRNTSATADLLTLTTTQGTGYPTDFQVAGDSNWYTNLNLNLAPGASKDITIRVTTDGVKRIATQTFTCRSNNSGRAEPAGLRVFNGSYAVMLVDDDNGTSYQGVNYEVPFEQALDHLGYLYENWDVTNGHSGGSPSFNYINGFDAIIWQTAYVTGNMLSTSDVANLSSYIDAGGNLYMNSMDLLTSNPPTDFRVNYLGFTNNTRASTVDGVDGDPITDGMVLLLNFPAPNANRVDTVNPTASATVIFNSEADRPAALRNETRAGRVVFNTIIQNAISTTDADPNNSETVIEKILLWFFESDPTAVELQPVAGSHFLMARPNPFAQATDLSFSLASAAAGVQLNLVDASGRLVRTLVDSALPAGIHRVVWDGRDSAGRELTSGIYFARLQAGGMEVSEKVLLVR